MRAKRLVPFFVSAAMMMTGLMSVHAEETTEEESFEVSVMGSQQLLGGWNAAG